MDEERCDTAPPGKVCKNLQQAWDVNLGLDRKVQFLEKRETYYRTLIAKLEEFIKLIGKWREFTRWRKYGTLDKTR